MKDRPLEARIPRPRQCEPLAGKRAPDRRRRPVVTASDLKRALGAFLSQGLRPVACDQLPNGGVRFHFTSDALADEDDLDREYREWGAKHGGG